MTQLEKLSKLHPQLLVKPYDPITEKTRASLTLLGCTVINIGTIMTHFALSTAFIVPVLAITTIGGFVYIARQDVGEQRCFNCYMLQ